MNPKQAIELLEIHLKREKELLKEMFNIESNGYSEALEIAIEALEKQMPKKPRENYNWGDFTQEEKLENYEWFCNNCDTHVEEGENYCPDCGQKLDWSENNETTKV